VARFDIYANPDPADKKTVPYLLDVQSNHLHGLTTRMVVPLLRASQVSLRLRGLNPELQVGRDKVVMDTASLGSVPARALTRPVGSAAASQLDVQDALDALFGAY
jgi:toxin CcdB